MIKTNHSRKYCIIHSGVHWPVYKANAYPFLSYWLYIIYSCSGVHWPVCTPFMPLKNQGFRILYLIFWLSKNMKDNDQNQPFKKILYYSFRYPLTCLQGQCIPFSILLILHCLAMFRCQLACLYIHYPIHAIGKSGT